jgi:membrane fusion protein, multidrug efflux system
MYKRFSIVLILMGLFLGGVFGYHGLASKQQEDATSSEDTPSSQKGEITGILRASHGVDLTTESAGLIKTIDFTSGGDVKKGEVIVTLTAEPEIAKLTSLQATAELAQITYARDKEQFSIQGVSRADLDADLAELKSKKADVLEQEAIVAQKIIRAPFDGRLGISAVNLGQYLDAGDKIVTLQALDPIYVDFYLPQSLFAHIRTHQTVSFKTNAYPNVEFEGKITCVNAKFNPATQKVQVEAILNNSNYKLFPGMSGTVTLKEVSK